MAVPSGMVTPSATFSANVALLSESTGLPIPPALSAAYMEPYEAVLSAPSISAPSFSVAALSPAFPSSALEFDALAPAAPFEAAAASVGQPSADQQLKLQRAILDFTRDATAKAIDRFTPLKSKILSKVHLAERLKFWGGMLTLVLSSTVVGSIVKGSSQLASTVLGFLALASSLLAFVANYIVGSDSQFVDEFGEASAKYEAAVQLRDRLTLYARMPDLFPDVEDRVSEATDLARYLDDRAAKWGLKF